MNEPIPLPLFPLNTVLYPGFLMPLVIFEPRYKAMIKQCLEESTPFGVVLIKQGEEVGEAAEPYTIGTTARIIQVQRQSEDRMYIWVVGEDRFQVQTYDLSADEYLVGQVAMLGEDTPSPQTLTEKMAEIKDILNTYVDLLLQAEESATGEPVKKFDLEEKLTDEPARFSYQVARLLNIDLVEKQTLLEIDLVADRLERAGQILQREIALLKLNANTGSQKLPWGDDIYLN